MLANSSRNFIIKRCVFASRHAIAGPTSRRGNANVVGAAYPLRDAEWPNKDLNNEALKIDLPVVAAWQPRRAFNAFEEKHAWTTDATDKLYKYIELELRGHDAAVLRSYSWFLCEAARHLDVEVSRVFDKVPVRQHWTTLRSAFGHKRCQTQYEWRTFMKTVQLRHLTESTALTYLEYVQRNLPEGVAMNVAKLELRKFPDYLQRPPPLIATEAEQQEVENESNVPVKQAAVM